MVGENSLMRQEVFRGGAGATDGFLDGPARGAIDTDSNERTLLAPETLQGQETDRSIMAKSGGLTSLREGGIASGYGSLHLSYLMTSSAVRH